MNNELICRIAICNIPGIGGVTAKRLISYCGSVEQVFKERFDALKKIPGIGEKLAWAVKKHRLFDRAEQELHFIERNGIRALYYQDDDYPHRLRQCDDGPVLLFVKGAADLNHHRMVAIVGTRNISAYGKEQCEAVIKDLAACSPMVISGLAYGVDACAHRASLQNNIPTVAVLGHGLDRVYPQLHGKLASQMLEHGALITDFLTGTKPDRENFPKRNRIIAGLCDAIIVIEAAHTGGALITANIANTYNRDVFALPGRVTDTYSQGCNKLIRINKAHMLESVADLQYIMNWGISAHPSKGIQKSLFVSLSEEEKELASFLKEHHDAGIDQIVAGTGFNLGKATSILLSLEFKEVVKQLPGKTYRLNAQV